MTLLIQLTWRSFCPFCWYWYLAGALWKTEEATRSYNVESDSPLTAFSSKNGQGKGEKGAQRSKLKLCFSGQRLQSDTNLQKSPFGKKWKMMVSTSSTREKSLFLLKEASCSSSHSPLGITDQWQPEKSCRWFCFGKASVWVFTPYASMQLNFAKTCSCSYHLNCW